MASALDTIDPITFTVLRNGLRSICSQGSALVERVAWGPVITQGRDYSVGILTGDGRLVAHGTVDITPHMGTYEFSVKAVMEDFGDSLEPGDVVIVNDPYRAGTHTQDVRLVRPLFHEDRIFAFAVACAHWSDMGGPIPGTFNPAATESWAEGMIIPPMLVYKRDVPVKSTFEMVRMNVRVPHERMGDLAAQYQATRLLERRLGEYVERYGSDTVALAFEAVMDHAERLLHEEIAALPDGEYVFTDFCDHDIGRASHPRVRFVCRLLIDGDQATIDWTDSDEAPLGPAGLTLPALSSATYDGTLHCFPHLVPLTHGIIRAITVKTRPGSATHVLHPTPVAGYCASGYEKCDTATMGAWGQALAAAGRPEMIFGGTVNLQNCCIGGVHPRTAQRYVSYTWSEGGQGARSYGDGPSFAMFLYGGGAQNQPIEVHERWYPVLYEKFEVAQDSAGHGRHRGGYGSHRRWIMRGDAVNSIHGDREEVTPPGVAGGTNGGPNKLVLNAGTDREENLGMFATNVPLHEGDSIDFLSNGGGGYGNPLEREPQLVLGEVIDGFLSLEEARSMYGVVIESLDPEVHDFRIDRSATEAERAALAGRELPEGYGPGQVHPDGKRTGELLSRALLGHDHIH
ncbi:MAG: hydantoinase B/oxoprolinase family protein [Solirubrobacterales bacterium]|nr:hydantoinase B/oxoprolinase family protein [Solirubrobacterales bacterium]